MARAAKVSGVATRIEDIGEWTNIHYHHTIVVQFNAREIILNTGGWRTSTTKLRMNQASNQFELGYQVHQHKCQWIVSYGGVHYLMQGELICLSRYSLRASHHSLSRGDLIPCDYNGKGIELTD